MAKTVGAAKKAAPSPKPKAKPKTVAKVKATPRTPSTRKRSGEPVNPFESVPDKNQSSIVAFGKKPKIEIPQSDVNQDSAVTVTPADASGQSHAESSTAGTFHTLSRDGAINFDELVRISRELRSSDSHGWKIRLHSFAESLDEDQFLALISQCKSHSRFKAFDTHMTITEPEWKFGDMGGDPLENILDMIHWLVLEDINVDSEQEKQPDQSNSSKVHGPPATAEGVETVSWLNI